MFRVGSAQHLYMMESEGMENQVTTRRAAILAAANEVKAKRPDYFNDIYAIVANHGLDLNSFTPAELVEFERRAGIK